MLGRVAPSFLCVIKFCRHLDATVTGTGNVDIVMFTVRTFIKALQVFMLHTKVCFRLLTGQI